MSKWPAAVVALVKARSQGVCEGCGVKPATELHHRQYRSRGGRDVVENALHVCGWGNHTGCHGTAHTGFLGESVGWAVRSGFDPAEVPVFRRVDSSWWRFTGDGLRVPVPAGDAVEFMRLIGAAREGIHR